MNKPSILIIDLYEDYISMQSYKRSKKYTGFWSSVMTLIGIQNYLDLVLKNDGFENQLEAIKQKYDLY